MIRTDPTAQRPAAATAAAVLLWALGGIQAAVLVSELVPAIVETATADAVDGMTAAVHLVVAVFLAAVLVAGLVIVGSGPYAGWRVLVRARWALVEGIGAAIVGAASATVLLGVTRDGRFEPTTPGALVIVGYVATVAFLIAARSWLPTPGWPRSPEEAPWWFRVGGPL